MMLMLLLVLDSGRLQEKLSVESRWNEVQRKSWDVLIQLMYLMLEDWRGWLQRLCLLMLVRVSLDEASCVVSGSIPRNSQAFLTINAMLSFDYRSYGFLTEHFILQVDLILLDSIDVLRSLEK